MKLHISHTTTYTYDEPVQYALQQLRLTPKNRPGQKIIDWAIGIDGGKTELEFDDHHNNRVVLASCDTECKTITVTAQGTVETDDKAGIMGTHGGYIPLWYFLRSTELTKAGKNIQRLANSFSDHDGNSLEQLHALSANVLDAMTYQTGQTQAGTTGEEALTSGSGVCQDHAHVFLSAARLLGYPARYVSGYLMLNDRVEQDASHAWVEAHVEGLGWVGFDISNGISPDERYIPVATGLDYSEAAPVSGMRFGDSAESMVVTLQVQQ